MSDLSRSGDDFPRMTFVLGTGRCGSTLIGDALALRTGVGFVTNLDNRYGLRGSRLAAASYRAYRARTNRRRWLVNPSEAYAALSREVSSMLVAPSRDLLASDVSPHVARKLRRFYASRAEDQGVLGFVQKFAGWPRARFLSEVFPEARFIHIIRDGRAVANSMVQQPWWPGFRGPELWGFGPLTETEDSYWRLSGSRFEVLAALQWKRLIEAAADCRSELDASQWLDVRYEDVLDDPQGSFQRLVQFSGEEFTAAYASQIAAIGFRTERRAAFRDDLSAECVKWIEGCTADELASLGYSTP